MQSGNTHLNVFYFFYTQWLSTLCTFQLWPLRVLYTIASDSFARFDQWLVLFQDVYSWCLGLLVVSDKPLCLFTCHSHFLDPSFLFETLAFSVLLRFLSLVSHVCHEHSCQCALDMMVYHILECTMYYSDHIL